MLVGHYYVIKVVSFSWVHQSVIQVVSSIGLDWLDFHLVSEIVVDVSLWFVESFMMAFLSICWKFVDG